MPYVIRNCPALLLTGVCVEKQLTYCEERTDCVIKQIVELCKHYKKHSDCGRDCPSFGRFLDKLLDKLDIQEVE